MEHSKEDEQNEQTGTDSESDNTACCQSVNRSLLPSKIFYFFYFSSWGSLIPYLALYFKEMMLSPSQVGILMGLRPFVNFIFNPLWGLLIDKTNKSKLILLIALVACISTTFSLSLIAPAEEICAEKQENFKNKLTRAAAVNFTLFSSSQSRNLSSGWTNFSSHSYSFYMSSISDQPWSLIFLNLENSNPVTTNVNHLFFRLFFILLFGNIVAAPALTIIDTFTVRKLGDQSHKYGSQRLWGSLGFGISAFIVGAFVSTTHYCPSPFTKSSDINYTLCFYSFAILMSLALVTATKIDLNIPLDNKTEESTETKEKPLFIKEFVDLKFLLFLYNAFFFGFLASFIKTFLFWHLKDIGGTPELFCIIVAIHCIAEVTMYFLSSRLISLLGHLRVLYLGLICYSIRCFIYWFLSRPWSVLPFEVLSGVTSAAVWSAMLSYIGQKTCDGNATTMQGLLHGVHWGLGYGCGEMIGGLIVSYIGTGSCFLILGFTSLILFISYFVFNSAVDIIQATKTRFSS